MARNTDVNAYFYVGIPRNSTTYHRLLADAKRKGISVPALIAVRIDDFYEYGSHPLTPVAAQTELDVAPSAINAPATDEVNQEELNAAAALDAWD